jgi:predicted DNA-binding transcriptional regulator AlpA
MGKTTAPQDNAERVVYVSDRDLAKRYHNHRSALWRWVETRDFPKPIRLSPGCTRWKLDEVEQWEARQATAPKRTNS